MQAFVDKTLLPKLSEAEKELLIRAENVGWPDYPRKLEELARVHGLSVPWQTLPGPRNVWAKYRLKNTAQR